MSKIRFSIGAAIALLAALLGFLYLPAMPVASIILWIMALFMTLFMGVFGSKGKTERMQRRAFQERHRRMEIAQEYPAKHPTRWIGRDESDSVLEYPHD